jgi:hypothetical protein
MDGTKKANNLSGMLDNIESAGESGSEVAIADILNTVGQRSFGPLLLVPGLIVLSPIAGIPGVGTASGIVIFLIAGQMLIGRRNFWVPEFIRHRKVGRERLEKSVRALRPVARIVDRILRPRLDFLTRRPFIYVVAATCVALSFMLPVLDMVPFTSLAPASAITAFGLAIIAHDGAVAAVAFVLSLASLYVVGTVLL